MKCGMKSCGSYSPFSPTATVGKNTKKIAEYIRNQLCQDMEYEQMSIKEFIDPFTGEPVGKNK